MAGVLASHVKAEKESVFFRDLHDSFYAFMQPLKRREQKMQI